MSQATSNSVASKFWNAGTLQIEAVKAPTNAKDMAENGAEAGSCCAMVAVPTPWALQPEGRGAVHGLSRGPDWSIGTAIFGKALNRTES